MFGETFWLKLLGGCLSEWDGQISSYHTQDFLLLAEYGGLDDSTPKTVAMQRNILRKFLSLETFLTADPKGSKHLQHVDS